MECEKALLNSSQHLVILGDFNFDLNSPQAKFLHSFMNQFQLHELVQCPTRVTATTNSHLDLILTNSPSHFAAIPCGCSDHHFSHSFLCPGYLLMFKSQCYLSSAVS